MNKWSRCVSVGIKILEKTKIYFCLIAFIEISEYFSLNLFCGKELVQTPYFLIS